MFHNILYIALENITQAIDGIDFHISIVLQTVDLGAIDIVARI